jgi:hypothetical protein
MAEVAPPKLTRPSLRVSTNPFDYNHDGEGSLATSPLGGAKASSPQVQQSVKYKKIDPGESATTNTPTVLCYDAADDELKLIRFLDDGRVYGYPGTKGSRCGNYVKFVLNTHPLISVFGCHRLHPYTSKLRLHVYYCVACLAVALNFVFIKTYMVPEISVCVGGCASSSDNKTCVGGYNDGLRTTEYYKRCAFYSPGAISAVVGVILLPYNTFLRFVATCGCLQGRGFFMYHCLGSSMKKIIEYCGGLVMTSFMFGSTFILILVVIECWLSGIDSSFSVFWSFAVSKLFSAGQWFLWTAPMFVLRFSRDREYFNREMAPSCVNQV